MSKAFSDKTIKAYMDLLEKEVQLDNEVFLLRENLIILDSKREYTKGKIRELVFSLMDKDKEYFIFTKDGEIKISLSRMHFKNGDIFIEGNENKINPVRIQCKRGKSFIEEYNDILNKLNYECDRRNKS